MAQSSDLQTTLLLLVFLGGCGALWLIVAATVAWLDGRYERAMARERWRAYYEQFPPTPPITHHHHYGRPPQPAPQLTAGALLELLLVEWLSRRQVKSGPQNQYWPDEDERDSYPLSRR